MPAHDDEWQHKPRAFLSSKYAFHESLKRIFVAMKFIIIFSETDDEKKTP